MSQRPSSLPPSWSAAELAANPREFAAFQWVTGFAEALTVNSPRKPVEPGSTEGQDDAGATPPAPPLPNLKFKGWEKGPRNSAANARRVAKAFSAVIPESAKLHLFTMGRETEDPEFDSAAMRLEIPGFGLVSGGVDLVIAKGSGSLRRPPPHNGLTMMDDAQAVIECDVDIAAVTRKQLRQLYVKTVLVHLLREKPVSVFLTDMENGAIKASVLAGARGVPMVIYERLSPEGFVKELQHCYKKPAVTAKAMIAIRRFKYDWCLAESRTRPPCAIDGRTGRQALEASEPAASAAAAPASGASPSLAPLPAAAAAPAASACEPVREGENKETTFVTPKKRGRKARDPSAAAVAAAAPTESEGATPAAAKPKAGATPKQRAVPKKMKTEAAAYAQATPAAAKSEPANVPVAPASPAVAPAAPKKAAAPARPAPAAEPTKAPESDSDSDSSSDDDSEPETRAPVKTLAKPAVYATANGAPAMKVAPQETDSSSSEESSDDED
ncbi:nuclear factor NF4 [Besnoitia besnoiti]|uniref:Nuclear factor NF4 n=1 Tax=Besnoitia besnoiti TaxID=94643 RepID=A0A2A9MJX7_BESBE|nr:nuclear factor NF4 [Besnoitia besnoiti]PFH35963.1 nuclear factor NF4 [Besnoitia besnoiti]